MEQPEPEQIRAERLARLPHQFYGEIPRNELSAAIVKDQTGDYASTTVFEQHGDSLANWVVDGERADPASRATHGWMMEALGLPPGHRARSFHRYNEAIFVANRADVDAETHRQGRVANLPNPWVRGAAADAELARAPRVPPVPVDAPQVLGPAVGPDGVLRTVIIPPRPTHAPTVGTGAAGHTAGVQPLAAQGFASSGAVTAELPTARTAGRPAGQVAAPGRLGPGRRAEASQSTAPRAPETLTRGPELD